MYIVQKFKKWKRCTFTTFNISQTAKSVGKVMATVFLDREGVLLVDFMPKGITINNKIYCETLMKLRQAIQSRKRGMWSND